MHGQESNFWLQWKTVIGHAEEPDILYPILFYAIHTEHTTVCTVVCKMAVKTVDKTCLERQLAYAPVINNMTAIWWRMRLSIKLSLTPRAPFQQSRCFNFQRHQCLFPPEQEGISVHNIQPPSLFVLQHGLSRTLTRQYAPTYYIIHTHSVRFSISLSAACHLYSPFIEISIWLVLYTCTLHTCSVERKHPAIRVVKWAPAEGLWEGCLVQEYIRASNTNYRCWPKAKVFTHLTETDLVQTLSGCSQSLNSLSEC